MAKKIGLYGGTFDPIHYGHLILAREALEKLGLAQITFVPAARSPHKLEQRVTDAPTRMEMLSAAIADEERFTMDDFETKRPSPSFTIDTIEELKRRDSSLARTTWPAWTAGIASRICASWCSSSSSIAAQLR